MIDLVDFADILRAKLLAECGPVTAPAVLFGRGHLDRQDNQGPGTANRVVVAPGDPDSGAWGELSAPMRPHVRAYPGEAKHSETVTLDVWGYDSSATADEGAQYRAMRVLWNRVVRAVGEALREGGHTHTWWGAAPSLEAAPGDRRRGERARVVFAIDFDVRAVAPAVDVMGVEAAPLDAAVEA